MISLTPLMCVGASAVFLLLAIAWRRSHEIVMSLSIAGLVGSLIGTVLIVDREQVYVTNLLLVDSSALFMMQIILIATIVVNIFSFDYLKNHHELPEEFHVMLQLSCLGAMVLVSSCHLMTFFLGLELLTVPFYCLIGYVANSRKGSESAVKYIILAGASAAILLFGMSLIYAALGTMQFDVIGQQILNMDAANQSIVLAGFALLIAGVGFKISAVPFHMWTPDIYEGAPLPATAYLATVSKGATAVVLLNLLSNVNLEIVVGLKWIMVLMAFLSMFGGNLLALKQHNIKRIMGYSSISHFGYILMAILAMGSLAHQAVVFYLVGYFATVLLIFGVLVSLASKSDEIETIENLKGLFYVRPRSALMLMMAFLSLMGIPFTALFMGKFMVLMAGIGSEQWPLIGALVLSSGIGIFVYLRIINAFFAKGINAGLIGWTWVNMFTKSTLAILTVSVLLLGLWPSFIISRIM